MIAPRLRLTPMTWPIAIATLAFLPGGMVMAQSLDIALPPNAALVQDEAPEPGGHDLATAPWMDGTIPTRSMSGLVLRETWRVPDAEITVQELAAQLAERIAVAGFDILLDCHASRCGGFDFRAGMDLGPSPDMYVDIGNFSYISASVPGSDTGIAITVSGTGGTLFVHVVQIAAGQAARLSPSSPETLSQTVTPGGIGTVDRIARLPELGAVTLDDLSFRTGASELSGRDYPSLVALADFLAENPGRRIVLVGHTDSEGGLEGNVRLSEARANAVRAHLVDNMSVDPARISAAGIGYLAPRASNDTLEGREANRRVEAVLLGAP